MGYDCASCLCVALPCNGVYVKNVLPTEDFYVKNALQTEDFYVFVIKSVKMQEHASPECILFASDKNTSAKI